MDNWTTISGNAGAIEVDLSALHQADIITAERALGQNASIVAASENMKRNREIALAETKEVAAAADSASPEGSFLVSRAKETMQAARAASAMRYHRRTEAGGNSATPAPLVPVAPTVNLPVAPAVSVLASAHPTAPPTFPQLRLLVWS